jgi:hypothetical protein
MAQRFIEHGVLRLGRIDERAGMLGHRGGHACRAVAPVQRRHADAVLAEPTAIGLGYRWADNGPRAWHTGLSISPQLST